MNSRGFTLIEVLVALIITGGSVTLIGLAWSGNNNRIRKITLNNNIAQLLTRKMSELEAKYKGKTFGEISADEGDFGDGFEQYKWKFETQPFEMPDLTPMLSEGENKSVDQTLITVVNKMREALGKAVLEGKLTVEVNVNGNVISHSITTLFVDYESEPNLNVAQ